MPQAAPQLGPPSYCREELAAWGQQGRLLKGEVPPLPSRSYRATCQQGWAFSKAAFWNLACSPGIIVGMEVLIYVMGFLCLKHHRAQK